MLWKPKPLSTTIHAKSTIKKMSHTTGTGASHVPQLDPWVAHPARLVWSQVARSIQAPGAAGEELAQLVLTPLVRRRGRCCCCCRRGGHFWRRLLRAASQRLHNESTPSFVPFALVSLAASLLEDLFATLLVLERELGNRLAGRVDFRVLDSVGWQAHVEQELAEPGRGKMMC